MYKRQKQWKEWIKEDLTSLALCTIGTIGDRVPLRSDNRIIIAEGLRRIRDIDHPALSTLFEGLPKDPTVRDMYQGPIPLVYTCRSKGGANPFVEMVLNPPPYNELRKLWRDAREKSAEWQKSADMAFASVLESPNLGNEYINIVYLPDLAPGLPGVCASRWVNFAGKPCVVMGGRGEVKGECRAPYGYNLVEMLKSMGELFISYGGHKPAAGFSADESDVEKIVDRMKAFADAEWQGIPERCIEVDDEAAPWDIDDNIKRCLSMVGPYGEGMAEPLFFVHNVQLIEVMSDGITRWRGTKGDFEFLVRNENGKPIPKPHNTVCLLYKADRRGSFHLVDWKEE